MAHAGNGSSRSRMGNGVGSPDNPLVMLLSAIVFGPPVLFLLARRDRGRREALWGDHRMTMIALPPPSRLPAAVET